jgi:hypothetical protein
MTSIRFGTIAAILLLACSGSGTMSREEIQSEIRLATSLAAQAELLLQRTRAGATSGAFSTGHASALAEAADKQARKLSKATPESGARDLWIECIQKDSAVSEALRSLLK